MLDLVRYAWDNSPLYRELWAAAGVTPDDITSIEDFTTKIPHPQQGRHHRLPRAHRRPLRRPAVRARDGIDLADNHFRNDLGTRAAAGDLDAGPAAARRVHARSVRARTAARRPRAGAGRQLPQLLGRLLPGARLHPVFADSWLGQGEGLLRAIKSTRSPTCRPTCRRSWN